jgi:hypothetical protein
VGAWEESKMPWLSSNQSKHGHRPDLWWKLMTGLGVLLLVFAILSL